MLSVRFLPVLGRPCRPPTTHALTSRAVLIHTEKWRPEEACCLRLQRLHWEWRLEHSGAQGLRDLRPHPWSLRSGCTGNALFCGLSPWKPLKVVTSCVVSACSDCFSGCLPTPPSWCAISDNLFSGQIVIKIFYQLAPSWDKKKTCLERRHLLNSLDKSWEGLSCQKTASAVPTGSPALPPGPQGQKYQALEGPRYSCLCRGSSKAQPDQSSWPGWTRMQPLTQLWILPTAW